ncbi:MAG: RES family NAD+ phosphorylase [Gaiellaceae bacterium]
MYLPPPLNPADLRPLLYAWKRGDPFLRCHDSSFGASEFNPRRDVSMRFRPFSSRGRTVPTLYGSATISGALSETLLHLVPATGHDRRLRQSKLVAHVISTLASRRDLQLVDLRDEALDDLGMARAGLIESPPAAYPETAAWASAFFHCRSRPDGLVWNSRQERESLAFVLFARGRVDRRDLDVVVPPEPLALGDGLDRVYEVAEQLDLTIII